MGNPISYAQLLAEHGQAIARLSHSMLAEGWPTEEDEEGLPIGYARSRADDEDCRKQIMELGAHGVHRDHRHVDRVADWWRPRRGWPALSLAMKDIRQGDTFVVWDFLALGVSTISIARMIMKIRDMGVHLHLLHEGIDTRTPKGRVLVNVFCAGAIMANKQHRAKTKKGLSRARRDGKVLGRRPTLDDYTIAKARNLMSTGVPMATVARQLKVSRQTLYNAGLAAFVVRKPKRGKNRPLRGAA